jgi:ribosomal protein RSM22 (predicted rRNA methylase)
VHAARPRIFFHEKVKGARNTKILPPPPKNTRYTVCEDLLTLGIEDDDDLIILHSRLEKVQFSCSLKTKKLLSSLSAGSTVALVADGKGVGLPKIDVPTFDGDILNWLLFWE